MTVPIIKAIAALIATATLGTGATGTATAAGLTDTRTDAAATTVTATADTSSLPDHLINGTFDYPTCPGGKASCDVDPTTGWGGFYKDFGGDNKFAPSTTGIVPSSAGTAIRRACAPTSSPPRIRSYSIACSWAMPTTTTARR